MPASGHHPQQLAPERVELATQYRERAEHRLECGAVVTPEIGDGLEVGPQPAQQPDQLEIASFPPQGAGSNAPG